MPQAGFIAYSATLFVGVLGAFLIVGLLQKHIEKRTGAVAAGILALIFALLPYLMRFCGLFPANGAPRLITSLFKLLTLSNAFAVAPMYLGHLMAAPLVEDSPEQTSAR